MMDARPRGPNQPISNTVSSRKPVPIVPKVEGVFEYEDPLSIQAETPTGRISVVGQDVGRVRVPAERQDTLMLHEQERVRRVPGDARRDDR